MNIFETRIFHYLLKRILDLMSKFIKFSRLKYTEEDKLNLLFLFGMKFCKILYINIE